MSDMHELGAVIAADTPEKCQGCYHPNLMSLGLARRVIEGDMTAEAAKDVFQDDMDTCKFGRVRSTNPLSSDMGRIMCGQNRLCGSFLETVPNGDDGLY